MNTMAAPGGGQANHANARSIARVVLATLALLAIPAIAMLLTDEVHWGPGDFLVAGLLLGTTGVLFEFGMRHVRSFKRRAIAGGAIVLALLCVWAELAVGIVGSPFAGS